MKSPCKHVWKVDQELWKEFCVRCGEWKPAHYQDDIEGQEGIPGYYNEGLNQQHPPVPEPEPDIDVSIMRPDDNTQPDIESVDCDALGHVWMWNIEACEIYCSRCGQLETA